LKGYSSKEKVLIFIVAYQAEKTIEDVLSRIPIEIKDEYDIEILIIDDSSVDNTFKKSHSFKTSRNYPFKLTILYNPINLGYGGNQKLGYEYAIINRFDFVVLLHGDGQYAPELLTEMLLPLRNHSAEAVFGSRMIIKGAARKGGMPLYKFIGNKILTHIQNYLLGTDLSEFHSGYRAFSVSALNKIHFNLNTDDFHFDAEIIIQLLIAKVFIKEIPIPTYYGDEISYVNGFVYAYNVLKTTLSAKFQSLGIFYRRKYDLKFSISHTNDYKPKLDFPSPLTYSIKRINKKGAKVIDAGSSKGYMSVFLQKKGFRVTSIDLCEPESVFNLHNYIQHDLNKELWPIDLDQYDYILLLDVIEHLVSPENFIDVLKYQIRKTQSIRIHASTGNVGFIITRFMLLFGQFNYGKRGILDLTHTRLFTFRTFKRLFEQAGFDVEEVCGVPAPFPLAFGKNWVSSMMLWMNQLMIKLSKSLFSYQIFLVIRPRPSTDYLLMRATKSVEEKTRFL